MYSIANLLKFIHQIEKLKDVLRHSWTSNGKRESVAEHSWRLSILIMLAAPYLDRSIQLEKALKMALIHDLAESIVGDIHLFELPPGSNAKLLRYESERNAFLQLKEMLENDVGVEFFNLWEEFEENKSFEANVVQALDKLEAYLQHNEADISTWTESEMKSVFTHLEDACGFDTFIKEFKEAVKNESIEKFKKSGIEVNEFHHQNPSK